MCPKHTDDDPLFEIMRSAGPGRCLIFFAGFIKWCNVINSVVPFSPFQGFFCRYYKSGATTTIITTFTCHILAPRLGEVDPVWSGSRTVIASASSPCNPRSLQPQWSLAQTGSPAYQMTRHADCRASRAALFHTCTAVHSSTACLMQVRDCYYTFIHSPMYIYAHIGTQKISLPVRCACVAYACACVLAIWALPFFTTGNTLHATRLNLPLSHCDCCYIYKASYWMCACV